MPRRIRAMSRKGRVFRNADIFVGGDGGRFGLRACVGENPAGKASGETARNIAASWRSSGSCRRNRSNLVTGSAWSSFFDFELRLVRFRLNDWRNRRGQRLATIFGQRFAGQKNGFLRGTHGR